jgi:hypothetical protein
MAAWEWQVWRCFDSIREAFEEKGWEYTLSGGYANEAMPLLAESGDYYIAFFERDSSTGVCWFELRDTARRRMLLIRELENIPTPGKAAELLASHGAPLDTVGSPRGLPLYNLPVPPLVKTG